MVRAKARKGKGRWCARGQNGFALIEMLVALAILGVVAVGFLSALTAAYGAVIVADRHTKAESLTRTEFEYLRTLPFSDNFDDPYIAFPIAWSPDENYGYPYYPNTHFKVKVTSVSYADTDNCASPIRNVSVAVFFDGVVVKNTTTSSVDPNRVFPER